MKKGGIGFTSKVKPMSRKTQVHKRSGIDKIIDFGKQLFASILRSRKGALSELSRLSRFQKGTKGFQREYERLLPLINEIKEAYKQCVLSTFHSVGFRLGIIDDTDVKKTGEQFPHEKIQHNHTTNSFYSGMKVISSAVYQCGKVATVSSRIVQEDDNKLLLARDDIDLLIDDYFVEIFLFDNWYCKSPVIKKVNERGKIFVSRLRTDSSVEQEKKHIPLDELIKKIPHNQFKLVKIRGKSYWIYEIILHFKTYGTLRVIASKEGVYKKPVFLTTNTEKFTGKFIVKLYLKRFLIEVFFKDAKQFLNFETFLCRNAQKWDVHLLCTNIIHWAIQKKKSISKTVRAMRENMEECLLFINGNMLIQKFIDELRKRCQT